MTYRNLDEVIAHISGRAKPLALYIYSNDQNNIDKILSKTSSGGVTINGFFSHYLENRLPFGASIKAAWAAITGSLGSKRSLMSAQSTYRRIDQPRPFKLDSDVLLIQGRDKDASSYVREFHRVK